MIQRCSGDWSDSPISWYVTPLICFKWCIWCYLCQVGTIWDLYYRFFCICHLRKKEEILVPSVEVPKSIAQHRVCMLVNAILDFVCFGLTAACCVLGLIVHPLCLKIKSIGLQMSHLFTIVTVDRFSWAAAWCTDDTCPCVAISGSTSVTVTVVHTLAKLSPLLDPWTGAFYPSHTVCRSCDFCTITGMFVVPWRIRYVSASSPLHIGVYPPWVGIYLNGISLVTCILITHAFCCSSNMRPSFIWLHTSRPVARLLSTILYLNSHDSSLPEVNYSCYSVTVIPPCYRFMNPCRSNCLQV